MTANDGRAIVLVVAIASAVLGGHLLLIASLASPLPFWDQWDAEARSLYVPYLNGTLTTNHLFASHNEHRIVFTRLLALLHLELAGEWNTRLEMILGTVVHAGVVVLLASQLMPLVARAKRLLLAAFMALLFALPIGYENTLWGFQSQFYFVALFGLSAVVCFSKARAFDARWFTGTTLSVMSYYSFSSGTATILVAAVLALLQLFAGVRERNVREIVAITVMIAVGIGMMMGVARSVSQAPFEIFDFIQGFVALAALPLVTVIGLAFVQGPGIWLALHTLATKPPLGSQLWVAVGTLGWIASQLLLFAYGRGTVMGLRYLDIAILAYPIGLVAVLILADRWRNGRLARHAPRIAVAWVFVMVALLAVLANYSSLRGAMEWKEARTLETASVAAHLAGNDSASLAPLPYPNAQRLYDVLAIPEIRAILPPDIRPADADVEAVHQRMMLKGALAGPTAQAVQLLLLISPAFIALALALFFAVATQTAIGTRGPADNNLQ